MGAAMNEPTEAQIKAACRARFPGFDAADHAEQIMRMHQAREWHAALRQVMEAKE